VRGLFVAVLIMGLLGLFSLPIRAITRPAPDVKIIIQDGGGYLVTTPSYKATIGADGNLHSLLVNNLETLDDKVAGSAGISFFVDKSIPLPTMTAADLTITATDGTYNTRYDFDEGFFTLTLRHTNPRGAAFVAIFAQPTAYVENLALVGVDAATPTEQDWGDVTLYMPTGEYLSLHGGTRLWGSDLGRQVWERSNIPPNRDCTLTIAPGQGPPRPPDIGQLTTLAVTVNALNNLALAGNAVDIVGRFENNSNQAITSEINLRVESTTGSTILEEKKPLTCNAHEAVKLTWSLLPKDPDFYTITATSTLNSTVKKSTTTFGYDIGKIAPTALRPTDFADYWKKVTTEAGAAEVKLTRLEDRSRSTDTVTVYRVGMDADNATCFGWLAVPKFPGKYPGLLLLPGDRMRYITPNAALADFGFVVMSIEPTGQSVDGALKPLISRAIVNLNNPASFGLRTIMIRYLRAITALSSVAEVDPHRLAVTGVGLGGGMAMVLGALDDRVQAVAPDVPFYCNIEYGRTSPTWPYQDVAGYLRDNPEQQQAVLQTLRYFDVANFVEQLTCPVFISVGIHDLYARPANIYGVYNRLPGPHALKLYQTGHEGGGLAHWEEKIRWLNRILGAATPAITDAPAKTDALPPAGTP